MESVFVESNLELNWRCSQSLCVCPPSTVHVRCPIFVCEFDLTVPAIAPLQDVTVTRVQAASEGVTGHFSLSWNSSDPVGRR